METLQNDIAWICIGIVVVALLGAWIELKIEERGIRNRFQSVPPDREPIE